MKTITIILLLTLTGCASFASELSDMHKVAEQCAGVSTIEASTAGKDTRISYVCSAGRVQS